MIRLINAIHYSAGHGGRKPVLINPDHIVTMITLSAKQSHEILGEDSPDAVETLCKVALVTGEYLYLCHDQGDIVCAAQVPVVTVEDGCA